MYDGYANYTIGNFRLTSIKKTIYRHHPNVINANSSICKEVWKIYPKDNNRSFMSIKVILQL